MTFSCAAKHILSWIKNIINWMTDFFTFPRMDQRKQLIPIKTDPKKPSKPHYYNEYDRNMVKMLFIIITSLLMMLLFGKLTFE